MAEIESAIFTNLCMVYDDRGNILVERRSKHKSWSGVTFPGGHVEPHESFVASVIREVYEETGLTIEAPRLCGVKQFPTEDGARYVVFLYKTNRFSGELRSSEEGEVFWIPRDTLSQYELAYSFGAMMPLFESDDYSEFCFDTEHGWEPMLF